VVTLPELATYVGIGIAVDADARTILFSKARVLDRTPDDLCFDTGQTVRLTASGVLDASFGTGGVDDVPCTDPRAVAVRAARSIVTVGGPGEQATSYENELCQEAGWTRRSVQASHPFISPTSTSAACSCSPTARSW
jgi:hypothetical protein